MKALLTLKSSTHANWGHRIPGTYSSLRFFIFTKASNWTDLIAFSPRFLKKNILYLGKETPGALQVSHVFEPRRSGIFPDSPGFASEPEARARHPCPVLRPR